jgi:hypothetical protein
VEALKQLRYLGTSNFVLALGSAFVHRRLACNSARRLTRAYKALNASAFPDLVSAHLGVINEVNEEACMHGDGDAAEGDMGA